MAKNYQTKDLEEMLSAMGVGLTVEEFYFKMQRFMTASTEDYITSCEGDRQAMNFDEYSNHLYFVRRFVDGMGKFLGFPLG